MLRKPPTTSFQFIRATDSTSVHLARRSDYKIAVGVRQEKSPIIESTENQNCSQASKSEVRIKVRWNFVSFPFQDYAKVHILQNP